MRTGFSGYAYVALSALCFGTLPILVKIAYGFFPNPLALLSLRLLVAFILIWIVALTACRSSLAVGWRGLAYFAVVGSMGLGFNSIAYFYGLRLVPASLMAVLFYTYPVLVNLFSIVFWREQLRPRRLFTLLSSFTGVLLVTKAYELSASTVNWKGVALSLTAGTIYAAYTLAVQRGVRQHDPVVVNTYVITFGYLPILPLSPPFEWLTGGLEERLFLLVIAMAVVPTVGAILLYLQGIRSIGAARASLVATLEPMASIVMAYTFLGERLEPVQLIGAGFVLVGVIVLSADGGQLPSFATHSP